MGELISYGGGVNSTAMIIMLVNKGWRGEIVFSDTGCEWPDTYCFMDYFEFQWLKPRGLEIVRLKGLPWQRKKARVGLMEYCEHAEVIPLAAVRWCTQCWKVEPIRRYADGTMELIGIAADEAHRLQGRPRPLVDAGISRQGCVNIIQEAGLDVPRKSGCFICPFQRDSQWKELWGRHPDLFEGAARLEELVGERRDKKTTLDPRGKLTLRDRQFRYEHQMEMFQDEDLRAYQPCVCGL